MVTIIQVSTFWWQFLEAMADEIPKKTIIIDQKKHVFYYKHALKLVKNDYLATRCQDTSPNNFKYGWSLSYELGKALQKRNRDLGLFLKFTGGTRKSVFCL
jgi:hypothetical protein